MSVTKQPAPRGPAAVVVGRLSTLDRFLPVWIGAAMLAGLAAGRWIPALDSALNAVAVAGISLPIAVGLLVTLTSPYPTRRPDDPKEPTGPVEPAPTRHDSRAPPAPAPPPNNKINRRVGQDSRPDDHTRE